MPLGSLAPSRICYPKPSTSAIFTHYTKPKPLCQIPHIKQKDDSLSTTALCPIKITTVSTIIHPKYQFVNIKLPHREITNPREALRKEANSNEKQQNITATTILPLFYFLVNNFLILPQIPFGFLIFAMATVKR